jgi:hypothetical protein
MSQSTEEIHAAVVEPTDESTTESTEEINAVAAPATAVESTENEYNKKSMNAVDKITKLLMNGINQPSASREQTIDNIIELLMFMLSDECEILFQKTTKNHAKYLFDTYNWALKMSGIIQNGTITSLVDKLTTRIEAKFIHNE